MSNLTLTITTLPDHPEVYRNQSEDTEDFLIGHGSCGGPLHMVVGSVNTCMALTAQAVANKISFPYVDGRWSATVTAVSVEGRKTRKIESIHSVATLKTTRDVSQKELEEFYEAVEAQCFISNLMLDAGVKLTHEVTQTQGCIKKACSK